MQVQRYIVISFLLLLSSWWNRWANKQSHNAHLLFLKLITCLRGGEHESSLADIFHLDIPLSRVH